MEWSFACPDWKERLVAGRSLLPSLPLNADLAKRAVMIFNKLRLPDVAGQPLLRDAAGDWQRDIVAALFGSLMPDGRRMVRKPFILVPKKNSKTTGSAGIMITALLMDDAPRQPYFLYGPSQEIAQGAFDQAVGMVQADPVLRDRFHIRAHMKLIEDLKTDSTLKIQTFDEGVATGVKPKGMLVDEIHVLGKRHYAQRVLGQLWGGLVSRPDGFMVIITTQSDEPPAGVFKAELQLARDIRDGRVKGVAATTLPFLYEFPEEFQTDRDQPWRDPACWHQVLPNLGRSVRLDLMEQGFAEAEAKGNEELIRWVSQHLNIQIGLGMHDRRWRGADHWLDNVDDTLTLETLLARCEVVTVGIDGGGLDDLFGLAVLGRERDTGKWLLWVKAWAVKSVLDLRKDIASRLVDFEKAGDIELVDTAGEIVVAVADLLESLRKSGLLPESGAVGLDPAQIGALVDELESRGFDAGDAASGRAGQIEAIRQGWSLSSAVWTAEFKLHDGVLKHAGQDMLGWCVGNAQAESKGNAVYISKQTAGRGKIDPLIAAFNAVKLMERSPVAVPPSPYASRGLIVI